jgi:hypothetical protein
VRFYTTEGNWDLVGNNRPVFFIQDGIKFPDLIHAAKAEPDREIPRPRRPTTRSGTSPRSPLSPPTCCCVLSFGSYFDRNAVVFPLPLLFHCGSVTLPRVHELPSRGQLSSRMTWT